MDEVGRPQIKPGELFSAVMNICQLHTQSKPESSKISFCPISNLSTRTVWAWEFNIPSADIPLWKWTLVGKRWTYKKSRNGMQNFSHLKTNHFIYNDLLSTWTATMSSMTTVSAPQCCTTNMVVCGVSQWTNHSKVVNYVDVSLCMVVDHLTTLSHVYLVCIVCVKFT